MNFARDVVDRAPPERRALVELTRDGARREYTFGEVSELGARLAGTLQRHGVRRGDVVMTLIGNRPEWALTLLACFRIGAVALPCNEQLRAGDLRLRLAAAHPSLILADERNRAELEAARPLCPVLTIPDPTLFAAEPAPAVELHPREPCLIVFTSGTTGEPKGIVHGQRYLSGQRLQAEHWLDARPGELVWCTAASGWSKSARNAFIAPWLRGAAALLHDARFDPAQRLEILASERVNVLCMAPTEYRVIAKRQTLQPLPALRALVAAGEALNPEVLATFREELGLDIRDGYGQTETGQLTANPPGRPARPGSMGLPLPGVRLTVQDGELVLSDPRSDPTFFVSYLPSRAEPIESGAGIAGLRQQRQGSEAAPEDEPWHTGDCVHQDQDGYLYFEGRADDLIISAGYRIGPFEVESALISHPAVAEAAVVGVPDEERGAVVKAVVVLREGHAPDEPLAAELQEHVKRRTAPYKYPRIVEFARELPKTASGKVRRALLRMPSPR